MNSRKFYSVAALMFAFFFSWSSEAELNINGGISARFDHLVRSGAVAKKYDNRLSGVDGHYALFLTYAHQLSGNYKIGFNCITVATTADGATKGFTQSALPVKHNWDKFFSGAENFAKSRGGFASYGDVNGDSNGPMCNDELNSFINTPIGKFTAGNILNPMRRLYDEYTINPVWGNQHSYYLMADIRANALQYSEEWGGLKFIAHLNTSSDSNASEAEGAQDKAYTSFVSYDFGNDTEIATGAMQNEGDWESKQVKGSANIRHKALGFSAKTSIGQINLGYSMMGGSMFHTDEVGIEINQYDHTFKAAYAEGLWEFQGFLSAGKMNWYTPATMGASYTIQANDDFIGQQINRLEVDRTRVDLWALYDLGKGAKTYFRLDTIQKKYSSPELTAWSATMRVALLEGGWMINF